MSYTVVVQPPARLDIAAAHAYLHDRAPRAADLWLDKLEQAIASLTDMPRRCGIAPESKEFPEEIRQLLHGRRGGVYRVLVVVPGDEVRVLDVRHGARQPMRANEIQP